MSDLKNVVIIGASVAGSFLSRALEGSLPSTHRIILVDSNEFAFYPVSSLRSAVAPGWEAKSFHSLAGFFPSGSRHIVLPLTKVVALGKGYVEVDKDVTTQLGGGSGQRIDFEICVLAVGSTYAWPFRALSHMLDEAVKPFAEAQQKLKDYKRIVIVGGGPAGIEYAGEILDLYPDKKLTLIQGSNRLLSDPWATRLSDKLEAELKSKGANIVLGQRVPKEVANAGKGRVELKDGTAIDADLIVNAGGVSPNTGLVKSVDPAALNDRGLVTVAPTLRILSSDPASPLVTSTYFATGDCADSGGVATAIKAEFEAKPLAKNILATLAGGTATAVAPPPAVMVVPLGPNGGFSTFPYVGVWGATTTRFIKGKNLFTDKFAARYTPGA